MKTSYIILATTFIIYSFTSCQPRSNLVLTDFTKELIALYINDPDDYYSESAKNKEYEIIVSTYTDTSNYYLDIHFNNYKFYKCWRDDFVGRTSYLGQRVMVYGNVKSVFYTVEKELKRPRPCKADYIEYDAWIWRICLYKDLSFCRTKTYKVTDDGDISMIQDLVAKYFKIPDTINGDEN